MNDRNYFGLPTFGLNVLAVGLSIFLTLLGIKALRTNDVAVRVANTSFVTSSAAKKLEDLANELKQQSLIIQQKDEAYQELKSVYERSLKGNRGYGQLQRAIETIQELPQVENIQEIQTEIIETEANLQQVNQK
jgi:hypothetical protein